jgi:hypothetical protein
MTYSDYIDDGGEGGEQVTRRGTNLWYVEEMHSRGLPYFLTDLENQEDVGFDSAQCKIVLDTLIFIKNEANKLSQRDLLRNFVSTYDEFRQAYDDWNGRGTAAAPGDILHRRVRLEELRTLNRRNTLAIRRLRKVLAATDDDAAVAKLAYQQFRTVVNSNPSAFPGLESSVKDVESI